jgi:hypothetical protein
MIVKVLKWLFLIVMSYQLFELINLLEQSYGNTGSAIFVVRLINFLTTLIFYFVFSIISSVVEEIIK